MAGRFWCIGKSMALKVSRRGSIPPFIVMDVLRAANERAAEGHDVVHLEVGQPSTGAPSRVLEAAKAAIDTDILGYTDALGLPELRQGLAGHYEDTHGITIDAGRIVLTVGSSGAFLLGFLSAFEAGDRVALASPGYPAYRNILSALGVEAVNFLVGAETNFQPTPALLDRIEGVIDGLIVTSPCNPTGTMVNKVELASLVDYCRERRIRLISDEIYHGITYGEAAETVQDLYLAGRKAEAMEAVPDEFIDEMALLGPADRIRERYKAWEDCGITGITVSSSQPEALELMADLAGSRANV